MKQLRPRWLSTQTLLLILLAGAPLAEAYYDPGIQRWINRDPLKETGHSTLLHTRVGRGRSAIGNLSLFVKNNSIGNYDSDGRLVGYILAGIATAVYACAAPQYSIAMEKYSEDGGFTDKFRHCWVSCRMSKTCGAAFTQLAGLGKEARDTVEHLLKDMAGGADDWIDSLDDLIANQQCVGWESILGPAGGWAGALCRKRCEDCCREKIGLAK